MKFKVCDICNRHITDNYWKCKGKFKGFWTFEDRRFLICNECASKIFYKKYTVEITVEEEKED